MREPKSSTLTQVDFIFKGQFRYGKGSLKNNFRFQILLKRDLGMGSKSVIPPGTDLSKLNVELLHLLIGDLLTFDILTFQQACSYGQSRLGAGSANVVEYRLKAA